MAKMGIQKVFLKLKHANTREKLLGFVYSMGATAVFHAVIQFFVYPQMERRLGADAFGRALSVLSMIAIASYACGYAAGCARLLGKEQSEAFNGDFNRILLLMGSVCALLGSAYLTTLGLFTPLNLLLFCLLSFFTMLRCYSEVEFKIHADFFRYMIYYLLISLGYILGVLLFNPSGQWMAALLVGEGIAVLYALFRSRLYRPPLLRKTEKFKEIRASISFLLFSTLLENTTLHADKIVLLAITQNGEVVTAYYVASLVGKIIALLTTPLNAIVLSYLVKYQGALTRKLWSMVSVAVTAGSTIIFLACLGISPLMIRVLYEEQYSSAMPILVLAILGQILYFASGALINILLRFQGERDQFVFNTLYAIEFFAFVIVGTTLGGLWGFSLAVVLANAVRFLAAILKGFAGAKIKTTFKETL